MPRPPIPVDAAQHGGLSALHRLLVEHFDDRDAFMAACLDVGCRVFGLSTGIVGRIQGDDYEVLDRHSPLIEIQPGHRYPLGDTWCAAVITLRQTLTHAGTDAIEPMRSHPAYGGLQLEAYIGTPIVVDGAVFGSLSFSDTWARATPFAADEIGLAESIAALIGRFIERQRAETGRQTRDQFYRSVAETLPLLHADAPCERSDVVRQVASTLADIMGLPLVWIGRLEPEALWVQAVGVAGPACDYVTTLSLTADPARPEGQGPMGRALRTGEALLTAFSDPVLAPWADRARRYGLGSSIVAAARTQDGGQVTLSVYASETEHFTTDLLDWAQRLARELATFWNHQDLLRRQDRLVRYQAAQREIQAALLKQPDPLSIYQALAEALARHTGADAVDVFTADDPGPTLCRVMLMGPLAEAARLLPPPPKQPEGTTRATVTLAFSTRTPVIRVHPARDPSIPAQWRGAVLEGVGAVGAWPVFDTPDAEPEAVFAVVVSDPDTFTAELRVLIGEIAEAAGLALRQFHQQQALVFEHERQEHLALHDPLTGLPNRRALEHHLEGALARARRHRLLLAVGMLDLDDFKPINDRFGHEAGDQVLIDVAKRLKGALRDHDYVARLGGDEFVVVLEDVASLDDLTPLLERMRARLAEPMVISTYSTGLHASLGIVVYPLHEGADTGHLLRLADQAMYRIKSQKLPRAQWWSFPVSEQPPAALSPVEVDISELLPYGPLAQRLLGPIQSIHHEWAESFVDAFYARLAEHAGSAQILGALSTQEFEHLKAKQREHLTLLLDPALGEDGHRQAATRAGRIHAMTGIEDAWVAESVALLRAQLDEQLAPLTRRDRRTLLVMHRRLALDYQWQLEGSRAVQLARDGILVRISTIAWSADRYLELIQRVADTLLTLDEVAGCAIGRPDASGRFQFEAVAGGEAFVDYLRAVERGVPPDIRAEADRVEGSVAMGRAWRSGEIQRTLNYATDPATITWREVALGMGIRSNAALPLRMPQGTTESVLTLYSPFVGGFSSAGQQAFLLHVQSLLDLALARLLPKLEGVEAVPYLLRDRWRAKLATDDLVMYYQPVIDLRQGKPVEVEALARIREDGGLILPARFLPAFGEDDLLILYRQGLAQALAARREWDAGGLPLGIAVNLPSRALLDRRYVGITREALERYPCPAETLVLEILESEWLEESPEAESGLLALKALGVQLAEDDLGSGYSTLSRLRHLSFDRVKIDQTLVRQIARQPLRTLRFVNQLTRLGHDLGVKVVVEGMETPGLVEAAMILGADLGQGYALSRPMPRAEVTDWCRSFRWACDPMVPRTALGALADFILRDERLRMFMDDPAMVERIVHTPCRVRSYLDAIGVEGTRLDQILRVLHQAALQHGPASSDYAAARDAFVQCLVEERIRVEESG